MSARTEKFLHRYGDAMARGDKVEAAYWSERWWLSGKDECVPHDWSPAEHGGEPCPYCSERRV